VTRHTTNTDTWHYRYLVGTGTIYKIIDNG
jgi:hypothetical protein